MADATSPAWPVVDVGNCFDDRLHDVIRSAAEAAPLARDAATGAWLVLRHHDVDALAHDPRLHGLGLSLFDAVGVGPGPLRQWYGQLMFTNEGDVHHRLRRLVQMAFTPRSVEQLRADTAAQARLRMEALVADGGGDLVDAFHLLATWVMCRLIGVPAQDVARFGSWLDDLSPAFGLMTPEEIEKAGAAVVLLQQYVDALVEQRRAEPGDDLVDRLIAASDDGDRLSHEELVAMVANLLVGGHDTTESQLLCVLLTLLRHPGELDRVRADPSLVPSAVAEGMRVEPSITVVPRTAPTGVTVAGQAIDPGSFVFLSTVAANRDPSVWSDAEQVDVARFAAAGAPKLMSFGAGPHYCLGANLARLTMEEAVRAFVALPPVTPATDLHRVAWRRSLGRSPASLAVALG